jgi:hypothetical protein
MTHSYGPPDPIPLPAKGREEEWGQGGNADAPVGRRRYLEVTPPPDESGGRLRAHL